MSQITPLAAVARRGVRASFVAYRKPGQATEMGPLKTRPALAQGMMSAAGAHRSPNTAGMSRSATPESGASTATASRLVIAARLSTVTPRSSPARFSCAMAGYETRRSAEKTRKGTCITRAARDHNPRTESPATTAMPRLRPWSRERATKPRAWNRAPNPSSARSRPKSNGSPIQPVRGEVDEQRGGDGAADHRAGGEPPYAEPSQNQRDRPGVVGHRLHELGEDDQAVTQAALEQDRRRGARGHEREREGHHPSDQADQAEEGPDHERQPRQRAARRQLKPEQRAQVVGARVVAAAGQGDAHAAIRKEGRDRDERRPERHGAEIVRHQQASEDNVADQRDDLRGRRADGDQQRARRRPAPDLGGLDLALRGAIASFRPFGVSVEAG